MFTLGALSGAYLTFGDDGALSSVTVQPYNISLAVADRPAASITRTRRPGPIFTETEEANAAALPLETHGRRVVQNLGGGERAWEIYQGRDDRREGMLALVSVTHTLESAATWRLAFRDCMKMVKQADPLPAPTGEQAPLSGGQGGADAANTVTLECASGATVKFSTPAPMTCEIMAAKGEITGAEVVIALPAGESRVEIVVEARPPYDLADTVVLCLPQQLAEAAVVATCVRGKAANRGKYVPVVDVLNPPLAPDAARAASGNLQAAMKEYQEVETELARLAGAAPAPASARPELILPTGAVARSEDKAKELLKRQQELQKTLNEEQSKVLTFAGWQRRWERVIRLVSDLRPARVVFLYPLPPELASAVAPTAVRTHFFWEDFRAQITEWEKAMTARAGGVVPSVVYFNDLEMLSRLAWEQLSGEKFAGAFTIPDDPRYYPLGVRRALQLGKPLLPKGRAGLKVNLEAATEQANLSATADEAVVVEADGTLSSLAAALYADLLNAPLVVHPAANPQDVITKLGSIQQSIEKEEIAKQSSAAYAYIGEHKTRFLQDPKVTPDMRSLAASIPVIELPRAVPTAYSPQVFVQMLVAYSNAKQMGVEAGYRYEQATWEREAQELTALVTARVEGLVRARMLKRQKATVFTVGMPYNFVDGWRDKTVSHVLVEPCLTVLRHAMNRSLAPTPAAFTVVMDAGVLRPVESPQVARRLRYGRTYPLVLREAAANPGVLQTYPSLLPVEGIFLDTLGDETSIFFVDQRRSLRPFSAAEVELTCELAYSPFVFSHVAFSWLAVGSSFMSAGAGGFAGTLWSVESEPAQEMALRALGGPEGAGPVAVDEMTRRAYLHLGLLDARRRPDAAPAPADTLPNTAARQSLYGALLTLAENGLAEQADPLFRAWESLGQEDLAAAGDDAGFVKEEMDAEEREYHRRLQAGRERRASRMPAERMDLGAAKILETGAEQPPTGEEPPAGEKPPAGDKPLFFVP